MSNLIDCQPWGRGSQNGAFNGLSPAADQDIEAIAALVNSAYRGRGGWTSEADLVGGQRTSPTDLRRDLAATPDALLLTLRENADTPILGVVWLEPSTDGAWYLGMLTVRPDYQDRKIGRDLLAEAESHAADLGATRLRMTVVSVRASLVAWYERRGYRRTGETQPFPYGDHRFGEPKRDDLEFVVLEKRL